MIAAAASNGVDTTVFAAFAVGLISFVSPCVLPLVPGYLSAVSGVGIADFKEGAGRSSRVLLPAAIFCLTFTLVFVALGMTATGIGSSLSEHRGTLDDASGILIIALGVFFLATPFVPMLNREWRVESLMLRAGSGGPLIAGAAFAVAWTPCIGPTLTTILSAAAQQNTVDKGGILLAAYSAGLAVPFLGTAVAFNRASVAFTWLRQHYALVQAISGAILITMGILFLTGEFNHLNSEVRKALDSIGLDFYEHL
ncbi:MAG: cytochrome c-type biosis protein [Solirubrobacteraceae bacterium]|nr:cytochrome c-type biosis protein [Solirubrobacteraceae bacterium]